MFVKADLHYNAIWRARNISDLFPLKYQICVVKYGVYQKSVDDSGNSKIRKFFKVETEKCSKFVFLAPLSLWQRQKSTPFSPNE